MNPAPTTVGISSRRYSDEGRARLVSRRGEPLFIAGWERVLFMHFEVDAKPLQHEVPFAIDRHEGKAYVSLVAFTMRGMHFRRGGRWLSYLLRPIATHDFLNVRTYVKHGEERGIYFITEWLSNWLSVQLGPLLYGLPYRHAKINYAHDHDSGRLTGEVQALPSHAKLHWEGRLSPDKGFAPAAAGSLTEFLLERYTAFTACGSVRRYFRVWHPPWPQTPVNISIGDDALLAKAGGWSTGARLVGAHYSPGFQEVWMGRAHRVR